MADQALRGHGLGSKSLADPSGVEMAARQEIAFDCPNDHHFSITFAAEAELPTEWECPRCGQMARRADGVEPEVVGDAEDLIEFVRDEQDRPALGLELCNDAEQVVDLICR